MKTQEEINKEIWARQVLVREARSLKRTGLNASDFVEIVTERPEDAVSASWEVWEAADLVPEVVEHIASWVWTFRV